MSAPILATKLYIPPPRAKIVLRLRLIERLNEGFSLGCKLTLISAPAGFGKTTLVSEWVTGCDKKVAWLSLDEGDNDPSRFLSYIIAALQTIKAEIGAGLLVALQSPQPPSTEAILAVLLNEITTIPDHFVLVLDDYHVIDAKPVDGSTSVDEALTFLLEHLPPHMHLAIATREDPHMPLARLRARGQLTELRAADLRFTSSEAAEFLNQVMGLNLTTENIIALETRTEGWIAGLQLAALSMQGHEDASDFIQSFTGSHHFVLDYLMEEVLLLQSESIQTFLLRTSILERLCGPLCDSVLLDSCVSGQETASSQETVSSQETLEYLEHANLFIVPLDNERRWYRYHHLFAELLRQRLHQSDTSPTAEGGSVAELHRRASQWYEDNGLELEAFQHAAAANDVERAIRLMEGKGIPLHYHFVVTTILNWLASLPTTVLDAKPLLWVRYASMALVTGQTAGVEQRLQAAETAIAAALQGTEPDDETRDLIGQIAAARATLALLQYRIEDIVALSYRALEYLSPNNLSFRFTAIWALGVFYQVQGDRAAAERALSEALSISQMSGKNFHMTLASNGLGQVQESQNQLYKAAATYQSGLKLAGDYPHPTSASQTYLGLARICYEWNDLDTAERYGQQSLLLMRQFDQDNLFIISEVFLARLKLARGDVTGAAAMLAEAEQSVRQHNIAHRLSEVAAAQVLVLLRQGNLDTAAHLAQAHALPFSQACVYLAHGDALAALAVLEPLRQQMDEKGWEDQLLKVMVLQTIALQAQGEMDKAVQTLADALALAELGGFVRIFVDEGVPMAQLLPEAASRGIMPDYIGKLLAAFESDAQQSEEKLDLSPTQSRNELLSQRELEVLHLIAQGLSNHEISESLFLALDTVKGHNRRIYAKLQVQSRTEAVARARELGLL